MCVCVCFSFWGLICWSKSWSPKRWLGQPVLKAVEIAKDMRDEGFSVLYDLNGRSLRAQMKYADKLGAKFNVVIGDNEVDNGTAKLKNMATGDTKDINLTTFVSGFYDISMEEQLKDLEINGEAFDFKSMFLGGNDDE